MAPAASDARFDVTPTKDGSRRFSVLALASVVCAVVTAITSLMAYQSSVPPSDSAYGQSALAILADPFVLMVAIPATIVGSVFGFAAALSFLLDTDLSKSVPATMVATPFAAGMCAAAGSILGAALVGFFFGVVTMMFCNHYFPRCAARESRIVAR